MVISKLPEIQDHSCAMHYVDDGLGGREEFDRNQIRTESGWDNPFRPGGDLSREADEIVNLIKGGKPITPTGDGTENGDLLPHENGDATVVDGATKAEQAPLLSEHKNGTANGNGTAAKSPQKESNGTNGTSAAAPAQTQTLPGEQTASHVIIEDKKKKKRTCCVIQ